MEGKSFIKIFSNIFQSFEDQNIPEDMEAVEEQILEEINHLEIGRSEGTRMVNFYINFYQILQDVETYEKLLEEKTRLEQEMGRTAVDVIFFKLFLNQFQKETWQTEMDHKLSAWLTDLKKLVSKISENYSA